VYLIYLGTKNPISNSGMGSGLSTSAGISKQPSLMIFERPTSTGKMEAAVQLTDSKTAHLFGPVFCGPETQFEDLEAVVNALESRE